MPVPGMGLPPQPYQAEDRLEPLYTYADVCRLLRVTRNTVVVWVKCGRIPSPKYFGTLARWTHADIETMRAGPLRAGTFKPELSPRAEMMRTARGTKGNPGTKTTAHLARIAQTPGPKDGKNGKPAKPNPKPKGKGKGKGGKS